MAKRYYVAFDTKDMAPKIKAVWIEMGIELLQDLGKGLPINLCNHPEYDKLYNYCRANPPRR